MARQATTPSEDKENEISNTLRKKPVRRATAKTAAAKTRKAAQQDEAALPLSPKKVTQISQIRARQAHSKSTAVKTLPIVENNGTNKSRRVAATRHTAGTQPISEPTTAPDFQIVDPDRRSRRPTRASAGSNAANGPSADVHNEPAAKPSSHHDSTSVNRNYNDDRTAHSPSYHVPSLQGTPRRNLVGTPMENKTISMPARQSFMSTVQTDITAEDLDALSDDELCGPKTPLIIRRSKPISPEPNVCGSNADPVHPDRSCALLAVVKPFQTPQKTMLVSRANEEHPQTTKVPLKPANSSVPRRPMSVSRGSSVAYVFHPLPKASRVHSPLKGPYQWPVTPSDEEEDPIDGDDDSVSVTSSRKSSRSLAGSRPNTPGSRRSTSTPQVRERFTQLFVDPEDDSDDDDDEPVRDYFPKLRTNDGPGPVAAADFAPTAESDESEDDSDIDLDDQSLLPDSAVTSGLASPFEKSTQHEESDAASDDTPQLPSGIFQNTPTQAVPTVSGLALGSSPASEDELAGTPTLTRLSRLSSSGVSSTPRPRVSFHLNDEDSLDDRMQTPRTRPRLSRFQTPHMRSALEEFNEVSLITPGADVAHGTVSRERTMCIDPSLLSQQNSEVESPRKDSVQIDDLEFDISAKPLPSLQSRTVSGQMAPLIASPEKLSAERGQTARLSLLLNTDGLIETNEDGDDSWSADVDTTVVIKRPAVTQEQATSGADDINVESESSSNDDSALEGSVIHNAVPDQGGFPATLAQSLFDTSFLEEGTTPHYALPTVSSDIRRKSMPLLSSHTPKQNSVQLRIAETSVRPNASPSHFAETWFEHQHQSCAPVSRRQSMLPITPSASKAQLLPSSLPRAISSLALRKRSSVQSIRHSYIEPATVASAAATPRPRCYTPSSVLTSLKLASARNTPAPSSPPQKLTSPKKVKSPRKVQTPARTTPASTRDGAFTPHPNAPLRGVVAYVEVFTRSALPASASFIASLQRLGAKVVKSFTDNVTHVIWKDGSPATLAKVKSARREGRDIALVGSRWVVECDSLGERVDESREEFSVDMDGMVGSQRRRKSLEPKALPALNAPVLTPGRAKSRMSVASEAWAESPMKGGVADIDHMPFSDDEDEWFENTPIREKNILDVPGSVPVQKVRREGWQTRRLTAWDE
ncbi:Hypothetical protein D9617_8g049990 [Elsinoe fawcettii]|nr:Hypothetical protein D9617_8g049990 [Elsinoe fawcettii]